MQQSYEKEAIVLILTDKKIKTKTEGYRLLGTCSRKIWSVQGIFEPGHGCIIYLVDSTCDQGTKENQELILEVEVHAWMSCECSFVVAVVTSYICVVHGTQRAEDKLKWEKE